MIKYLPALAIAVALSGCSSGSDGTPSGATTNGTTTGDTTGGDTTGGDTSDGGGTDVLDPLPEDTPDAPVGDIVGTWFGDNGYGEGVLIIDADSNVYSYSANTEGQHETVFGPISEQLQRFVHRDSVNPASADSFNVAGDLPSSLTTVRADDIRVYNLEVSNDGQSINNTFEGGVFSMTRATENDVTPISLEGIAGDWVANSSFCAAPPETCNLQLNMTFTAAGAVTGATVFGGAESPLSEGTASVAAGATQYLNVSFTWLERTRKGVVYADRNDSTRLILNTVGPEPDYVIDDRSFSARLTRQ